MIFRREGALLDLQSIGPESNRPYTTRRSLLASEAVNTRTLRVQWVSIFVPA